MASFNALAPILGPIRAYHVLNAKFLTFNIPNTKKQATWNILKAKIFKHL